MNSLSRSRTLACVAAGVLLASYGSEVRAAAEIWPPRIDQRCPAEASQQMSVRWQAGTNPSPRRIVRRDEAGTVVETVDIVGIASSERRAIRTHCPVVLSELRVHPPGKGCEPLHILKKRDQFVIASDGYELRGVVLAGGSDTVKLDFPLKPVPPIGTRVYWLTGSPEKRPELQVYVLFGDRKGKKFYDIEIFDRNDKSCMRYVPSLGTLCGTDEGSCTASIVEPTEPKQGDAGGGYEPPEE